MSDAASAPSAIISTPTGGGALHGIGEKFTPDLHTGTGNFTVPLALPPGRCGFQPRLGLVYSTGQGNGPFGLGWSLTVPGVSRRTGKGVPRYGPDDVFVLSGAEDLVPMSGALPGRVTYRPRTEGLFAQIDHIADGAEDYWEVTAKDGSTSWYGTPRPKPAPLGWFDPAVTRNPQAEGCPVYAWAITRSRDTFGNMIEYGYRRDQRDSGDEGPHVWDQPLLTNVDYVDHGPADAPRFLVHVRFEYEPRQDAYSHYRAGFEIRTSRRCRRVVVQTEADTLAPVREYRFRYRADSANGFSLLSRLEVSGYDDGSPVDELPPLEFDYTRFIPAERRFQQVMGADLPPLSPARPDTELVDLFGTGLPDLLQMNGTVRYWRNLGDGRFDLPRPMRDAPAGLALSDHGVQLVDADGDGRADLMVTAAGRAGYYPLGAEGSWDRASFRRYERAPSFDLKDRQVRLTDLDGDGVTDALRAAGSLECFFNHPVKGWYDTRYIERSVLEGFPDLPFSDPRVKLADMTGDGLQDIVLVQGAAVRYWPNLGRGSWGRPVTMRHGLGLPFGYDPGRVLLGDVDGDGLADLVYVDARQVLLWVNHSGNGWSEDPVVIPGTPPVTTTDGVRLVDLLGTGVAGVLWTADPAGAGRVGLWFLDLTGGTKPYLLDVMDNHLGAVTAVRYAPSTRFAVEDRRTPSTRWRTPLPFPVQVVERVEVRDEFSRSRRTTEYRYRHGYWDGAEREFHGFGLVEQRDTETFEDHVRAGPGTDRATDPVPPRFFSPPTLQRTWFHLGAVGPARGDWSALDLTGEHWPSDGQLLDHGEVDAFLASFPQDPAARRAKRDALRALRGSVLRTELYSLDGSAWESRPVTVTEYVYGLSLVPPDAGSAGLVTRLRRGDLRDDLARTDGDTPNVFFPHRLAERTTRWERGDDPMTVLTYLDYRDGGAFDPFGRSRFTAEIACPRGWRAIGDRPTERYLATSTRTEYAAPTRPDIHLHDRVASATTFELTGTEGATVTELALARPGDPRPGLRLNGQTVHHFDGPAFAGLPRGQVERGAAVRSEELVLTEQVLADAYGDQVPPYLVPDEPPAWTDDHPAEFRSGLAPLAGYAFQPGGDDPDREPRGWFAQTARCRFDFQTVPITDGRGLLLEALDPLWTVSAPDGHRVVIEYDGYALLPVRATDAAGLTTSAAYDYRVLRPSAVTDANGAEHRFTYTPLGLLATSSVRGRTAAEGDQLQPGVRLRYELTAYDDSPPEARQPIHVRSERRVHHDTDTDIPADERDATITTVEYSDGFGRLLQTRALGEEIRFGDAVFGGGAAVLPADQAEDARADITGLPPPAGDPHVVVSGWQTYDNKGRVVESYEPFLSDGWEYLRPGEAELGRSVTTFYDPLGRVVRTVQPDGAQHVAVHGVPGTIAEPDLTHPDSYEPTPWETYLYDANDNAGRTHPETTAGYRHHHDTPSSICTDARGRPVDEVVRHREAPTGPTDPLPPPVEYHTRTIYDSRGNPVQVSDTLQRPAFRYTYDLANRPLRVIAADSGDRAVVHDAGGSPVEHRDGRGGFTLRCYDGLNRPIRTWARERTGAPLTLVERTEYGDGGTPDQSTADRTAARAAYRLGRVHRQWDGAGRLTCERYDFTGSLQEKTRQVVEDSALLSPQRFRPDWTDPTTVPLESDGQTTVARYDALGRPYRLTLPRDAEGLQRTMVPSYNRAGALESIALARPGPAGTSLTETFVEHIAYDAQGQRILTIYGNGTMTRCSYDRDTLRLRRLRTEHVQQIGDHLYRPTGPVEQDFGYDHDLSGNVLRIRDRAPGSGVRNTPLGRDALDRDFGYDPLYRLRTATGRECDVPPVTPWLGAPRCTDPTQTRAYTETYRYDELGGLEELKHLAAGAGTTRTYARAPLSNRLQGMTLGNGTVIDHQFDENGNLTGEGTSRHFDWDHADRLAEYCTQVDAAEPTVVARYLYDAAGQRVKKIVREGPQVTVTVYIDGWFEQRWLTGMGGRVHHDTVHVADGRTRIATVRIGPAFPHDTTPAVQYHLGDHLSSSHIVLDDAGAPVSREEYTPYGETSFGSHPEKRYRYSAKEQDTESGLYYFGYRYYAPWITRWITPDPAGAVDGLNLYQAMQGNPVSVMDSDGTQTGPPEGSDRYRFNVTQSEISSEVKDGIQEISVAEYGNVEEVFQPQASEPQALKRAEGMGRIEGQDVIHTVKGMWNGVAGEWLGLPRTTVDPMHEGAELIGRHLGQNLALEGIGAGVARAGGKALEYLRPAREVVSKPTSARDFMQIARRRIEESNASHGTSAQDIYASALKPKSSAKAVKAIKGAEGEFSIVDWSGYPAGRPRPTGPFRVLGDAEYEAAKEAKKVANNALRRKFLKFFKSTWTDIHEVHPVKFGGSPTDLANKEIISPPEHWEVTAWWNALMRWVTSGG
ncbi:FG-GAP-like repeat-containing protein [Streptomyces sp. NBC_00386]|uniref:SpvB/TcaC N-terminal domain-containing protein n=1 Tax=Streptomyces sp. NBC_00386 TaxID=2975734 RepID=UPI002E1F28DC